MSSVLEQRSFGRTGEKVSVIGLGGGALYKHSREQGVATVNHALDLGVTYFENRPLTENAPRITSLGLKGVTRS